MVNDLSPASLPASRDNKTGWHKLHQKFAKKAYTTSSEILLLGDSIIRGLTRYENVWENYFPSAINLGIGGDKTQNVLWRMRNLRLSHNIKFVIVHCGTNNIDLNSADDIANALVQIAKKVHIYNPDVKVVLSSILPRDNNISIRRNKIIKTNNILKDACKVSNNVYYFQHDHDWLHKDGNVNANYYYVDNLHLSKDGNRKFAQEIKRMIQTIRNDVDIHPPYLPTPIHPYSTHAPPFRKFNLVKRPKWEVCEYAPPPSSPTTTLYHIHFIISSISSFIIFSIAIQAFTLITSWVSASCKATK